MVMRLCSPCGHFCLGCLAERTEGRIIADERHGSSPTGVHHPAASELHHQEPKVSPIEPIGCERGLKLVAQFMSTECRLKCVGVMGRAASPPQGPFRAGDVINGLRTLK